MTQVTLSGTELVLRPEEELVPCDHWLSWLKNLALECVRKAHLAFLPVTRVDFLKVVQKVDGVVNQGDLIAHRLLLHELMVPPSLVPQMKDMVCHSTESVRHLQDPVKELNQDLKKAIIDATWQRMTGERRGTFAGHC